MKPIMLICATTICLVAASFWMNRHAFDTSATENTNPAKNKTVVNHGVEKFVMEDSWSAANYPGVSEVAESNWLSYSEKRALDKLLRDYKISIAEVRPNYAGNAKKIANQTQELLRQREAELVKQLGDQSAKAILSVPAIVNAQNRSLVFGAANETR